MYRPVSYKLVDRTPEEIVERCHRYGVPLDELHNLPPWWFNIVAKKNQRAPYGNNPRLWKPWIASVSPKLARYPYPPGVERGSPEWCRLRDARKHERLRAIRQKRKPFIEGYDDLATYVPKRSTKAP